MIEEAMGGRTAASGNATARSLVSEAVVHLSQRGFDNTRAEHCAETVTVP
jgi:hypothetical protein